MFKTRKNLKNDNGFTLVELMITVFLTAIAVISIYRGYTAFSHSADAQEQIIEMQQNLRVGMHWLEKDIRRAGMEEEDYDEFAGFIVAAAETVGFKMDFGGTGPAADDETWNPDDPGDGGLTDDDEWLTYKLVAAPLPSSFFNLVRTDENNGKDTDPGCVNPIPPNCPEDMTIINNVDALNFVYLDEGGSAIGDPLTGTPLTPEQRWLIRSVQVSMVVRTTNEDYRYTNNETYKNIRPGGPQTIFTGPGDNFRRRVTTKQIKIRNAGL